MVAKKVFILGLAVSLAFLAAKAVFSQEQAAEAVVAPTEMQDVALEESAAADNKEPETQWLYGDVINLDPQNKSILVKTLDYETDQEKEVAIATDEKTIFENIKSLDEIKPNDTVSVDYVAAEGKNIARNISLERPDAQPIPQAVEQPEAQAPEKAEIVEEAIIAPTVNSIDNSVAGY